MKINKFGVLALVVILVIATFGLFYPKVQQVQQFGVSSGPDHYNLEIFRQGVIVGGNVFATTSAGTVVYTAGTLMSYPSIIKHTASSAVSASFPASSTLASFLPNAGDRFTMNISPLTSAVTLASSTGVIIHSTTGGAVISAGSSAQLNFLRKANSDIQIILTTTQ